MDTFKEDTNTFLKKIVENHIEENIEECHLEEGYDEPLFPEWEEILYCIIENIEYQIEIDKEQDEKDIEYPYDIKIIKYSINDEKRTIKLFIINMENDHVLQTTLTISLTEASKNKFFKIPFTPFKPFMEVSIISKKGFIVYK